MPQPWWDANPASESADSDRAVSIGLQGGGPNGVVLDRASDSHLSSASEATGAATSIQRSAMRAAPGWRASDELPLIGGEATRLARAGGSDVGAGAGRTRPVEVLMAPVPSAGMAVQASHSTHPTQAAAALPSIVGTPIVQRIEGAAPDADPDPNPERSDGELEELADALFGRIRGRLRSDLLHDREAKGLAFDHI